MTLRNWLFGNSDTDDDAVEWREEDVTATYTETKYRITYVSGESRDFWGVMENESDEYAFYECDPYARYHSLYPHTSVNIRVKNDGDWAFTAVRNNVESVEPLDEREWRATAVVEQKYIDGQPAHMYRPCNDDTIEVISPWE